MDLVAQAHNNRKKRKEKKECKPNVLEAKTENQRTYIRSIIENDITFCTGPSGSGKSFIASGIAARKLLKDEIDMIIVTRPLVCTGKDLGSLPGELGDKIKPYLQPMEENLKYFLGRDKFGMYYNQRRIRFEPLETMRGSTFHDSYMILDEAQNCTLDQIKMFMTRMGQNAKFIINGDPKQTDLPFKQKSGLLKSMEILRDIEGIDFIEFDENDIVRHPLVKKIIHRFDYN